MIMSVQNQSVTTTPKITNMLNVSMDTTDQCIMNRNLNIGLSGWIATGIAREIAGAFRARHSPL